ncbi:Class 3 lipase protein [Aphelenchoides fujianensis]|nr:Class 3 lipase protein [Aphelenchoides fujianensis]
MGAFVLSAILFLNSFLLSSQSPINSPKVERKEEPKKLLLTSDAVARDFFFPLAAGAYSDFPEMCLNSTFSNAQLHAKVKVLCGNGYHEPENCFGYTAAIHDTKTILIAFRGTHGLMQLLFEGQRTILQAKVNATIGGQIGDYFATVYASVMEAGLLDSLQMLLRQYPDYNVAATGHSLGGALAAIAAAEIVALEGVPASKVSLITFGQPRTGDSVYAAAHDETLPHSYRVTHSRDLVPHVPMLGFEDYRHHMSEVWYDNNMASGQPFVECDEDESDKCSNGKSFHVSVWDHLYYYNVFLTDYGIGGCLQNLNDGPSEKTREFIHRGPQEAASDPAGAFVKRTIKFLADGN